MYFKKRELTHLRDAITARATETRSLRAEAQTLIGLAKHEKRCESHDPETRNLLLAYGWLRGRSISQMESEHTRDFPYSLNLAAYAPGRPEDVEASAWADRLSKLQAWADADLKQWKATCKLARLRREAEALKALKALKTAEALKAVA